MALLGLGIVYQVAARKLDISRMSISDIETELQVRLTTEHLIMQLDSGKIQLKHTSNARWYEI